VTYAVGGILATIYLLLGLLLLAGAISVGDLALCSDHAGVVASGESDCIDSSSAGRALGLALAYGSVLGAFTTVVLGVVFARRREQGRRLIAAAVATPVLALGAILLLPISF
jgi:hypothetical protein